MSVAIPPGKVIFLGNGNGAIGPSSGVSTDKAIARWNGTSGRTLQNSVIIVADTTGAMSGWTTGAGLTFHGGATIAAASGVLTLTAATGDTTVGIGPNASNLIRFGTASNLRFRQMVNGSQVGAWDTDGTLLVGTNTNTSGAGIFQVAGVITGSRAVANLGSSNVSAAMSRGASVNTGATAIVVLTLPTAVTGLEYIFIVDDTDGIQVVANAGDIIRIAGNTGTAAGSTSSTTIGSVLRLLAIDATYWDATAVVGTWTNPT